MSEYKVTFFMKPNTRCVLIVRSDTVEGATEIGWKHLEACGVQRNEATFDGIIKLSSDVVHGVIAAVWS